MHSRGPFPLAGALAVSAAMLAGCSSSAEADLPDPTVYAREVFASTNAERDGAGLAALEWNDCLASEAIERANAVKDDDVLEHAPLAVECTDGDLAGENLSRIDGDPDQVTREWMDSPSHAANILTASYEDGAVGCVPAERALACSWLAEGAAGAGSLIE